MKDKRRFCLSFSQVRTVQSPVRYFLRSKSILCLILSSLPVFIFPENFVIKKCSNLFSVSLNPTRVT